MKQKVALIICNDMHMDIENANCLLNRISQNENYEIVCDYTIADIVIIQTCGFGSNKMYSMHVIADVRINAPCAIVIVTGCLTKICSKELEKIPNIVVKPFKELLTFFAQETLMSLEQAIPQNRVIISEGCLHKCSYCVYPQIVDKYKSKSIEEILAEIEKLYDTESTIYITGAQETSDYGVDLYGKRSFADLLKRILSKFPNSNYVIGWFNPDGLTQEVVSLICKNENIVEIMLHIQHCDSNILKAMNRPTIETIEPKIRKLKKHRPDLVISTEVIVGFPGETEESFNKLVEYLSKGYFEDIGVASYEAVQGTKAAVLSNQVPLEIKEKRMKTIKERFGATCYPADEESSKSVIEEYIKAYEILKNRPKNILKERQTYNNVAGVDTRAKIEEFGNHLRFVLECVTSSRSDFDFKKNKKILEETYTQEAKEIFYRVILCGSFKEAIKERSKKLLLD